MYRRCGTAISLFGAYPARIDGRPRRLGVSGTAERLFQCLLVRRQISDIPGIELCCDDSAAFLRIGESVPVVAGEETVCKQANVSF